MVLVREREKVSVYFIVHRDVEESLMSAVSNFYHRG